ncbi:2-dehydro-3-deoxy-6-phosphogalactonate aldolase [Bordetella bronchialis]|uniref:2-dehydro-3-deoxy-6-phosphogalactonate aldolase n=1 Tax=Bordetella bronchialis TaxID=463025 RepID=A0A193FRM3_9BORD|nr:2-dehydro-3-deoxy-6-phosphogalactonate aldolase [Bordetella bronchialis]ANN65260.1 2-dehydro-3-deoxy-6-phosphogalactonate aldolase [Bordetella bronchialis]ANN70295.1 2-dehydro-3-deoxy-6-phosphogalactonate aldolase [Bordetella bronchialis]
MSSHRQTPLQTAMAQCGLIAILRGIKPAEAEAIGDALYQAGFRIIEVPLNSPEPLESIRQLRQALPLDCMIGAGTVLDPAICPEIVKAGGEIVVMPHGDPQVIRAAKSAGMACCPGVATPTEAFAALAAGADVLKMFPAEQLGPAVLKAWRAVIPKEIPLVPVGGITPARIAEYAQAGASGFGLGSALYKPGMNSGDVAAAARDFVAAWRNAYPQTGQQA